MEGEVLAKWLRELQGEFVVRMMALDEEAREVMRGGAQEDGSVVGGEVREEQGSVMTEEIQQESVMSCDGN
jgi:DNA mismatch repair protein MSH4